MGFHPAYKFKVVRELVFENGVLIKASDLSSTMEQFRAEIANCPLKPTDPDNAEEIRKWVEQTFSLKYKL